SASVPTGPVVGPRRRRPCAVVVLAAGNRLGDRARGLWAEPAFADVDLPRQPVWLCPGGAGACCPRRHDRAGGAERVAKWRTRSPSDLCEYRGKTVLYYSWGNQQGQEFLAEAVYEGTLASFLRGYCP